MTDIKKIQADPIVRSLWSNNFKKPISKMTALVKNALDAGEDIETSITLIKAGFGPSLRSRIKKVLSNNVTTPNG
jgi:hypothetical protein